MVYNANNSTIFYMAQVFAEGDFRTNLNKNVIETFNFGK